MKTKMPIISLLVLLLCSSCHIPDEPIRAIRWGDNLFIKTTYPATGGQRGCYWETAQIAPPYFYLVYTLDPSSNDTKLVTDTFSNSNTINLQSIPDRPLIVKALIGQPDGCPILTVSGDTVGHSITYREFNIEINPKTFSLQYVYFYLNYLL